MLYIDARDVHARLKFAYVCIHVRRSKKDVNMLKPRSANGDAEKKGEAAEKPSKKRASPTKDATVLQPVAKKQKS